MSTLIQIETARLTLQLLTLEQVELYLLGNNSLEKKCICQTQTAW